MYEVSILAFLLLLITQSSHLNNRHLFPRSLLFPTADGSENGMHANVVVSQIRIFANPICICRSVDFVAKSSHIISSAA